MSFPPLIALVLVLALASAPARATPPVPVATPSAVPRFTLFGWVAPPVWEQTAARYQELAATGMNAAVLAWEDPQLRESNLARLDLAAEVGIRCLIADHRFERVRDLGIDTPEAGVVIDSIVADYRDHPGFLGYYLGDEPKSDQWPNLTKVFAELRARDPEHPAWNNLSGYAGYDSLVWVADNTGYLEHVRPTVLCNDHYDFRIGHDLGRFVANVAGLRTWSLAYGVPFWSIVQLVPHGGYRPITDGQLAWQVSMLLAYGTRGVGYFTYWTPAPDPEYDWGDAMITHQGDRTPWYDEVLRLNARVRPAGETLAGLTWISTQHAGSVPRGGQPFRGDDWLTAIAGRAAVGRFTDAAGVPHLLVMNADSLAAREVTLTLTGATGVARLGSAVGDWQALPVVRRGDHLEVTLPLSAGEFALLRIDGTFTGRSGRLGPVLAVSPSPARDEVRFDVARIAGEARIEIVDATGRRVWLRRLPAG
ncbi:MAG TPA: hypothetical protein VJY35_11655, partial [Candidatus Eisenbacteria bacterium]|nr:hypothetical protein [Candidatus Eisenbacteria bacterium]